MNPFELLKNTQAIKEQSEKLQQELADIRAEGSSGGRMVTITLNGKFEMMGIKVPIISVVVGEGGSGGALALGVGDSVVMLENAVYSVISPEGCASILWKDAHRAPDAADALKLTSYDLLKFEVIEKIIPEENKTYEETAADLKEYLVSEITKKMKLSPDELLDKRYKKFRKIGEK